MLTIILITFFRSRRFPLVFTACLFFTTKNDLSIVVVTCTYGAYSSVIRRLALFSRCHVFTFNIFAAKKPWRNNITSKSKISCILPLLFLYMTSYRIFFTFLRLFSFTFYGSFLKNF